jgi:hypothetical protein
VGNEEILHRVKEESNSGYRPDRRKNNMIRNMALNNCIVKHDIA